MRSSLKLLLTMPLLLAACGGDSPTMTAMMPAPVDTLLTVSTGDFAVAAGAERTQCRYVPLPTGDDVAVTRFVAHMPRGSHHFNLFYLPPGNTPPTAHLGDCTEALRIYLAGSQWQDIDYTLPAGKAIRIPHGSWLALESHFVNATSTVQQGHVDVTLHTTAPSSVKDWVGVYFDVMNQIALKPHTSAVLKGRCPVYKNTNVFVLTSHMHHFGSQFDIDLYDDNTTDLKPLYRSTDYEHPSVMDIAQAPLVTAADQGFEWRCHYTNDRDTPLVGGDSAENNEMCIMAAFYWPAAPGIPYCFADASN